MMKHLQVKAWIKRRAEPFTLDDVIRDVKCSRSTVDSAIARHFTGQILFSKSRKNTKTFFKVFAPLDWTPDDFKRWRNKRVKSGNSRAKIYILGKGEVRP